MLQAVKEKVRFLSFLYKRFAVSKADGSVGRADAPHAEAVPSATGLNPPVATTPDQGVGKRSEVGPGVSYCGPLLLHV